MAIKISGTTVIDDSRNITNLASALTVAQGGTGQTTYTNGQLLIGNTTGNTLAKATLTAGTGITVTNGTGTITIAAVNNGTVTSVGGTGTVSGLTLSGTVTSTGNLTLGGTLAVAASNFASQTTKTFLAAPNATAGVPTFRAIVASDVPTLNQNTTGTAANVTGTVAVANGGTGRTTLTNGNYLKGAGTSAIGLQSGIPAGDITSGTLPVARGGTGLATLGTAGQALVVNSGATALEYGSAGISTGKAIAMALIFGF